MKPHRIKSVGYLISSLSVALLAIVSYPKAKESGLFLMCLIAGVATSIIGMFCRWLSYELEERLKAASARDR